MNIINEIDNKNRIFGLDVLRFVAIFLVIFGHASGLLPEPYASYHESLVLLDGVSLFFVLSGFLIGQILIKSYFNSEQFTLKSIQKFWIMRWMRTLPAYYFMLVILIIVHLYLDNSFSISNYNIIAYFLFLQNLFNHYITFFNESWSLSVEEWFYLTAPIIIFLLNKCINNKHIVFILTISILILFSTTYRYYIYTNIEGNFYLSDWDVNFRRIVATRLDSIAFGIIGAYLSIFYTNIWKKYKKQYLLIGVSILMIVIILKNTDRSSFYSTIIYFPLSAIGTLLLLPYLSEYKRSTKKISFLISYTSIISYSLYLTNYSLIRELIIKDIIHNKIILNLNISQPIIFIIEYLLYWILLFVISHLMYKHIETPFIRSRKKVLQLLNLSNKQD